MSDEEQIRDLIVRFADAVNRMDMPQFAGLWTPEATWIIGPPTDYESSGSREEVAAAFENVIRALYRSFVQLVQGTVVDVVGDEATARSYIAEVGVPAEADGGYYNYGTYVDELVRTDEGWRFRTRRYSYLYLDTRPLPGQCAPLGGTIR